MRRLYSPVLDTCQGPLFGLLGTTPHQIDLLDGSQQAIEFAHFDAHRQQASLAAGGILAKRHSPL
ncbi:MAG TPA: hypothetical protein VGF67_27090 [Ktedonobacteraceae bacterium]